MARLSLSLHISNDQGKHVVFSDDMALGEIVTRLLRASSDEALDNATPDQCTILISRQIESDLNLTLNQLGVRNGDALSLIVHVPISNITLVLDPMLRGYEPLAINRSGLTLGRRDEQRPETQPDRDLSYLLPELERQKLSQQQARLFDENGGWSVQLVGRTPMYVNSERLVPERRVLLHEGDVIFIGSNPNYALLRFAVHYKTET